MSLAATTIDPIAARDADAELNFIAPMTEKPYRLTYTPDPGEPDTNAVRDKRVVRIHDMRPRQDQLSMDWEGFVLRAAPTALRDFDDEGQIEAVYYPEAAALVAEATGAAKVYVFDHTIRRNNPDAPRLPVTRAHNDYTDLSAPQRLRDFLGDEAETWIGKRFAIINVWRPINGPAIDMPLALCAADSLDPSDVVHTDLVYRDRKGEVQYFRFNPEQRWYYAPEMSEDEAVLLKCYDSATDGRARFAAHSAFMNPHAPEGTKPRESIELRSFALFD